MFGSTLQDVLTMTARKERLVLKEGAKDRRMGKCKRMRERDRVREGENKRRWGESGGKKGKVAEEA